MNKISLPEPGASAEVLLAGPAGRIETLLAAPRERAQPAGCAIVCHPHPLYGGAMSNKVAYTLAASALKAGLYALRFNFRGVGRSEGAHDHGRGEAEDVLLLVQRMRELLPQARLVLAGFSFGAFVSLSAAARARPDLLISVAPPFGKYLGDAPPPARADCPWLVLHSRDDDVVAYEETAAVLEKYAPPPQLVTVDGAGHFFNGRLALIGDSVVPFIRQHWPAFQS